MTDQQLRRWIGYAAVLAPTLHSLTDLAEWITGGFSATQLWLNYSAFIAIPFAIAGLFAVQRPRIGWLGLVGAILYGIAFIYYAHTSLYAIQAAVPTYPELWERLGPTYTAHGVVMVLGGLAFGAASLRAKQLPAWACAVFLVGVIANAALALAAAPEMLHTAASLCRNLGLAGMGASLLAAPRHP